MDYRHLTPMSYKDREHQATQYIIEDLAARVEQEKKKDHEQRTKKTSE